MLLKEVVAELIGMFVADAWLTIGALAVIAAAAIAIDVIGLASAARRALFWWLARRCC